jgi:hypothetical protein
MFGLQRACGPLRQQRIVMQFTTDVGFSCRTGVWLDTLDDALAPAKQKKEMTFCSSAA